MRRPAGRAAAARGRLGRLRQRFCRLRRHGLEKDSCRNPSGRCRGSAARRASAGGGRGRRRRGCGADLRARQGRVHPARARSEMSAVLKDVPELALLRERDLDEVMAIENAIYTHPWTRGNFADSLRAGYECRSLRAGRELVGYFVLMVAAHEAHLLNLSIAAVHQRSGHGSALLGAAAGLARDLGARNVFLEVRPSNRAAQALYTRFGFRRIATRRGYYPAHAGREDALVLTLPLK